MLASKKVMISNYFNISWYNKLVISQLSRLSRIPHFLILMWFSYTISYWFLPSFAEGDWKVTIVTGDLDNAGTKATVSLYVCGEARQSGPIILGSGKHQLFNPNSTGIFRIKLIHCNLLAKIYYDILSLK